MLLILVERGKLWVGLHPDLSQEVLVTVFHIPLPNLVRIPLALHQKRNLIRRMGVKLEKPKKLKVIRK